MNFVFFYGLFAKNFQNNLYIYIFFLLVNVNHVLFNFFFFKFSVSSLINVNCNLSEFQKYFDALCLTDIIYDLFNFRENIFSCILYIFSSR